MLLRSMRKYAGDHWGAAQRLGWGIPRVRQPIWIHAASVGESRAIAPLAQQLSQTHPVLITTTTPTGRDQVLALAPDCTHAFLPYDLPWIWAFWLRRLQPRTLVLVETELWPNLIAACARRSLPVMLLNARMSAKSEAGYAKLSRLTRPMMRRVQVLAQTQEHAAAFERLGAPDVQVMGNLKYDLPDLVASQIDQAREQLGAGVWWVAASTHEGEEAACLAAFKTLAPSHPNLRLLIVPRHPQRFAAVAQLIQQHGYPVVRLSDQTAGNAPVVLGDAMGQLRAWLTQAAVCFVGGTLIKHGGQNPIEAAAAGAVIVAGPSRYNFPQVFKTLESGALVDADESGLAVAVEQALGLDGGVNQGLMDQHRGAMARAQGAIERIIERV
ncbi:MAG: 3-deoxy-D-manno-octulosonic acid transferase [Litorivicinus sp.]